jgi:site-specific DNA recombinase
MNGVVYVRVSSKEQLEGTSLESQESACREYARTKNIKILKLFIEQGESAKFADRTQLLELIDFCRKNKGLVNGLLVWKVDRFARNVADHFSVKATLAKYGVEIMSVTEPIDANPEGRLMETILAGFAEFDNNVRAMRTVQGMRRRIQEGIFPWQAPLGYKSATNGIEKKNRPDLPDDPAFSILKRAFKEFATGAYTQADIGRLMETWGLVSARRSHWPRQSLHQLFTNPFYAGILIDPWSGEEFQGAHPALVTRGEFEKVQRVIARRNCSVPHQKDRVEFPLRGLVRCNECRHPLTATFSRGRNDRYPYYLCHQTACSRRAKSIRAADVHGEFTSYLDEIAPTKKTLEKLGDRLIETADQADQDVALQQKRRRRRTAQLDAETAELIRMRAQNLLTDKEFLEQKRRLADQKDGLANKTPKTLNAEQVRASLDKIVAPLANLRATWEAMEPPQRSRFEQLVFPAGFVSGRIRTADLGRLFSSLRTSDPSMSSVVPPTCRESNPILEEIQEFRELLQEAEEAKLQAA